MVVVAVAGGSGNVGRTIVETLRATSQHEVIVLGRKAADGVVAVDYGDVDATADLLKSHNVHTVISTVSVTDQSASDAQVNLIKAAAKSGTTKRFIVSGWGVNHPDDSPFAPLRRAANDAVRATGLEWTSFSNGYFLDYYGVPHLKSNVKPLDFVVDMRNRAAAIPGSGDDRVALTYTHDVARYVAAVVGSSDRWDETTYCYGDRVTWNEFVKEAEAATGSKFNVVYDSVEKLQKGEVTELPSHLAKYEFVPKAVLQGLFSMFGGWVTRGIFEISDDKAINSKYPEIHPLTVKDVVALWKGK